MPQPTTPRLKWLFRAYFEDGSVIEQTNEDKCLTRTDGTGSAFTDVLARDSELLSFELVNGDESVLVDLTSGIFSVNERPLIIHDQNFEPSKYKLRLVYFRETRAEQNVNHKGDVLSTAHYINRYFIGWQTTANGKNVQHTIAVG